jgi:hypothetical protein
VCKLSVDEIFETLNQENFSGIYHIFIRDMSEFESTDSCPQLHNEARSRNINGLIYIGKASGEGGMLARLRQELLGVGRGTFFRSIGAVLGESPRLARNQREIPNYVFDGAAKERIKTFIRDHLVVELECLNENIEQEETRRIEKYKPPLNIDGNTNRWQYLIEQRERCRNIARGGE